MARMPNAGVPLDAGGWGSARRKAVGLLYEGREEAALDHLCKSWERRERLPNGGAVLAQFSAYLGREPGEYRINDRIGPRS